MRIVMMGVLFISLAAGNAGLAGVVAYEGFDYAAGTLSGSNGGSGFSGAWSGGSWKIAAGSLSYPAAVTLVPTGNSGLEDDGLTYNPAQRTLATPINLQANGTNYISVLMHKTDGGATSDVLSLYLHDGSTEKVRFGSSNYEKLAGGFNGVIGGANGGWADSAVSMPADTNILVVAKLVTSATGSNTLYLMRYLPGYPLLFTEPTGTWNASLTATNMTGSIDTIKIAAGIGTGRIDEIRIGTTWADVAPSPDTGLLAYEGFDYEAGTLNGKSGGDGFDGAWDLGSWKIGTGSLSYPAEVTLAPKGNSGLENDGAADSETRRTLSTSIDMDKEGVYYFSALMNKTDGGASGDILAIWLRTAGGAEKLRFGISSDEKTFLDLDAYTVGTVSMPADTNILVVAKLVTFAPGTAETLSLVRYLPGETVPWEEPTAWHQSKAAESSGAIGMIGIVAGKATGQLDEIRIGTTWTAVVGERPPASGTVVSIR